MTSKQLLSIHFTFSSFTKKSLLFHFCYLDAFIFIQFKIRTFYFFGLVILLFVPVVAASNAKH